MTDEFDQDLLSDLRRSLGGFGFQWLCACAVYPGLRFPLTVHLGRRLAEKAGRPAPDEEEHMALCRLPWFRRGWMPEELRLALLKALSPDHRRTVREAIEELFYNAIYQKLDASESGPALDFARPSSDWRARLQAFNRTRAPTAPEQDAIFVRYMMGGAPTETDLRLDRRLRHLFGARLAGWLDRKTLTVGAASLLSIGLLWLGSERLIKPMVSQSEVIEALTPEMVVLPGGTFQMGALQKDDEFNGNLPSPHQVEVPTFAIAKHEVTVGEFAAFIAATGYEITHDCFYVDSKGEIAQDGDWENPGFEQTAGHPVVCVSWQDVRAYIGWLNDLIADQNVAYRLPSEAEWEYAARAGTITPYSFGDEIDESEANFGQNFGGTTEVGQYPANRFGVFDMHGNVWEWVEDVWHDSYEGAPQDGSPWLEGNDSGRMIRGGSWIDAPEILRSAFRDWFRPDFRYDFVGFRLARTLLPLPSQDNSPGDTKQDEATERTTASEETRYRVTANDSLSLIANLYDISIDDLADANNIEPPYHIYPGEILRIPWSEEQRNANVPQQPPETAVVEPPPLSVDGFLWPSDGEVIKTFKDKNGIGGGKSVSISAPKGSPVLASNNGIVAYAGEALSDYGRMVLLRHAEGYVTLYAHNDVIMVKEGDVVRRGQQIAEVGDSGDVTESQVYFELRKGTAPIDPFGVLDRPSKQAIGGL